MDGRDVLLAAPCGSGKSLCYEVAIDIIRQQYPNKILLLSLPVNSILEEKAKHPRVKTAYITMSGAVHTDGETADDGSGDIVISDELLQGVLNGEFPIVAGHAESWLSSVGRMIIKEARKKDMIGAIVFDEVHKSLRWKMRPRMQEIRWFIDFWNQLLNDSKVRPSPSFSSSGVV